MSVAAEKGNKRVRPDSFIATMSSGHTGIFKREKEGGSTRVSRLGIQEMILPSIAHTLQDPTIINIGLATFQASFAAAFQNQLTNEIRKSKR